MQCDVAVIGAGPAGSIAAAALARLGARVALIDGSHPREKPCGGGLTGRALRLVEPLVPLETLPRVVVRGARFVDTVRGQHATVGLSGGDNALVVVSRARVDAALFDAAARAGAMVVRDRVAAISQDHPRTITTARGSRIDAGFIVGADGANSLVRRRFATAFSRNQLSIGTGFHAHGITSEEIVLEMLDDPSGYVWSFPRPDHLAIGICAQASDTTVGTLRSRLTHWIDTSGIARGARLEAYSWPIPSLQPDDFTNTVLGGDGWLTIGDAAGLVDPITREGIFFALQSGLFAAEALAAGPEAAARRYANRVRDEITCELRAAALLKAGFFRARFTRAMIDALASSSRVRALMANLIAGTQPYRTLKWKLAATFEVGLAWRWIRDVQRTA